MNGVLLKLEIFHRCNSSVWNVEASEVAGVAKMKCSALHFSA